MVQRWERHIEATRDLDYEVWRADWAFEAASNRFWDLDAMMAFNQQAWRTTNGHHRGEYIDPSGKPQKMSYCDRFILDPEAQRVLATTVAPEQPLITDDRYLNLWRDYWARLHADKGQPDGSEAVQLFASRGLPVRWTGRNDRHAAELIGYGLFHPARLRWSILLISDPRSASHVAPQWPALGMDNASILPGLVGLPTVQRLGAARRCSSWSTRRSIRAKLKFGAVETLKSLITEIKSASNTRAATDIRSITTPGSCSARTTSMGCRLTRTSGGSSLSCVRQQRPLVPTSTPGSWKLVTASRLGTSQPITRPLQRCPAVPAAGKRYSVGADALMDDWVVRLGEIVDSSVRIYPVAVTAGDMAKIVARHRPTHQPDTPHQGTQTQRLVDRNQRQTGLLAR